MADYRKRLKDMSPEEREKVAPGADNFADIYGDRTKKPLSVKAADAAISLATPIDSIVEIQEELEKENPDYVKIGMLGGIEAIGLVPAIGTAAKSMIRKGADIARQTDVAIDLASTTPKAAKTKPEEFSGTIRLQHGYRGDKPKEFVSQGEYTGDRYDSDGGVFGSKPLYMEDPDNPAFLGESQTIPFTYDDIVDVDAAFDKAFVLTPDTVGKFNKLLKDIDTLDDSVGPQIVERLEELGYDGLIIRGFPDPTTSPLAKLREEQSKALKEAGKDFEKGSSIVREYAPKIEKLRREAGVDEMFQQPQVLALRPEKQKVVQKYAEGGVAMDEQMDAVFKSVRTETDPVSGNEVPPGSLPEEVRDDIPAMLSEGEYVVPADVLRYYGVKFFEDLRAQAKMGLAEMEANGRIGGEPIEEETEDVGISDEDLMVIMAQAPQEEQAVGASNGGLMGFQTGGLNLPEFEIEEEGGLEYRSYVNSAGNTISIPFFNNEPMAVIPEGYSPADEVVEEAAPQAVQDDDGFDAASAQRAREEIESGREDKTIDFSNPESVAGAVNTYYSSKPLLDMVTTTGLGLVGGLGASYGIKQLEKNNLLKGINAALDSGTIDTKTRNKLKRQKQFLEDKNEWKNEYEKKTEGLGLMDGIKSFFDFDLGDTAKQYSRDTEKYKSDKDWSAAATGKWVDATNLVQSLGSDADPREWHEAIQAQAEASREATAAAQAASGRTGFFSPPEEKEEDDE